MDQNQCKIKRDATFTASRIRLYTFVSTAKRRKKNFVFHSFLYQFNKMGIKGLTNLISEHAPAAIKSHEIKSYFGRKVAIEFMIAVRQQDGQLLQNEDGETTSHLMGMFYRTVRMVDHGIKPVYVFDGKPPTLKSGEVKCMFHHSIRAMLI